MKSFLRIFMAALMAAGSAPVPGLWAEGEAPVEKLSERLTSQEKSLYVALREAGDTSFNTEELVKPATPALLAAWRTSLKARAEAYLKTDPAPADKKGKPAAEQINPFEKTYLTGRMEAAGLSEDKPFLDLLALAKGGEEADTLIRNIRDLIRKDLEVYAQKPGEENANEVVMTWAKNVLGASTDLAKANRAAAAALAADTPQPPKKEPPKPDALRTAIAALFKNKIEAAVIEHVARKQGVAEWTQRLNQAAADKDQGAVDYWRMLVRHAVEEHLRTEGKPSLALLNGLGGTFARLNIPNADTLAYFCDWAFPNGTAQAVEPSADAAPSPIKQLEGWTDKTLWAAGTARDESVKAGAAFVLVKNDPMPGKCTKYRNDIKSRAALNIPDSAPEHTPSLANNGVPSPDPFPAAEDKKADPKKEKKEIPWRSIAIGAGAGALALGILGMLFAGPVGALVGAAMGGLFYGAIIAMRHGVI